MIKNIGYSEFVLLIDDTSKEEFDQKVEKFQMIVDIVSEYDIKTKKNHYWVVQLVVLLENRSLEELCKFVYKYFPFIAMRQNNSTYILASDKKTFKDMVNDIYGKEKKKYFLYDMLSIDERYKASCNTGIEIDPLSRNRLLHNESGSIYSLIYNEECIFLFTNEPEITIMDESSGEVKELDITDGLGIFDFHVAILK